MKIKLVFLFVILSLYGREIAFAQRGKDGSLTVTASKVVNEYTKLTSDASAGLTTITVTNSGLNTKSRFSASLSAGDLVMIIQIQGATIKGTPTSNGLGIPCDSSWGGVTNYNNCGNYEFAEVLSIPTSTTINISCPLSHSYSATGKTQVIRVPRYSSLTVNNTITCDAWDGTSGGIVAIEVQGTTTFGSSGIINVQGLGFRGGAINDAIPYVDNYGGGQYSSINTMEGAEKGEGIAGYQSDYDAFGGRYCRGAAANAGGGGTSHNSGGGGGANAGDSSLWLGGFGIPDVSVANYITAWNLENPAHNFSSHISTGGGRGGYSFVSVKIDPTTLPPGKSLSANGDDKRRNIGGLGGRPLNYSTGRIFMGGGGGAGDQDNKCGNAGGSGGGIAYLLSYGPISGTGKINANGNDAPGTRNTGIDAAGGGGGGGTVIINSTGALSGITITANGGKGGNQNNTALFSTEAEGPGGGGGGGYIATTSTSITKQTLGGANGTTNAVAVSKFPPNGATKGADGFSNSILTPIALSAADVSICSGSKATLNATLTGSTTASIIWFDAPTAGNTLGTGNTYTTPNLTVTTTYYVGLCPGSSRQPVVITVNPAPIVSTTDTIKLCSGTTATLTATSTTTGVTYNWTGPNTFTSTLQNPSITNATSTNQGIYSVIASIGTCHSMPTNSYLKVISIAPLTANNTGPACKGTNINLSINTLAGASYSWSGPVFNSTSQNPTLSNPNYTNSGIYTVTVTIGSCSSTANTTVKIDTIPTISSISSNTPICIGATLNLAATSSIPCTYNWTGPNSYTSNLQNPTISNVTTQNNGTYSVVATSLHGCQSVNNQTNVVISSAITANIIGNTSICSGASDTLKVTSGSSYLWSTNEHTSYIVISPSTSTSYSVTVTSGTCTAATNITVNINSTLVTNAGKDTAVCKGASVQLGATNGISYAWSPTSGLNNAKISNPIATPTITTKYIVTATSGNCTAIDSVLITINNPPTINAGKDTTLVKGNSITLNAIGSGSTYLWSPNKNINNNTIPNPIYYKNKDGKYLDCNLAFLKFFGKTKEEVIGKTAYEITKIESATIFEQYDLEVLKSNNSVTYELKTSNYANEEKNIIFYKAPFVHKDETLGIVGLMLDITSIRAIEDELKDKEEHLELQQKSGQFF